MKNEKFFTLHSFTYVYCLAKTFCNKGVVLELILVRISSSF